ncbi:MAG: BrnT family toxin [Deltaproteobacteria bacterium]|nr:BrnT family toxin [Deltaproteobacteria bacterium]
MGTLGGEVVVVVHTPRGPDVTRIISMRKANRRERKIHQKRHGPA